MAKSAGRMSGSAPTTPTTMIAMAMTEARIKIVRRTGITPPSARAAMPWCRYTVAGLRRGQAFREAECASSFDCALGETGGQALGPFGMLRLRGGDVYRARGTAIMPEVRLWKPSSRLKHDSQRYLSQTDVCRK